jgi:hypothetical protein
MNASPSSEKDAQMSKISSRQVSWHQVSWRQVSWRQVSALALAAFFVVGSLTNIFAPGSIYEEYLRWGYPHWFHFVTGSLELATAVLLARAQTRLWGSALGCTVMLAALATVTLHGEYGHGGAAADRGDTIDRCRVDRLAEAAPQLGMTDLPFAAKRKGLQLALEPLDSVWPSSFSTHLAREDAMT